MVKITSTGADADGGAERFFLLTNLTTLPSPVSVDVVVVLMCTGGTGTAATAAAIAASFVVFNFFCMRWTSDLFRLTSSNKLRRCYY